MAEGGLGGGVTFGRLASESAVAQQRLKPT